MSNSKTQEIGILHDYEDVDIHPENAVAPLPGSSKVLDLSELAAEHAQSVPLRFQVANGFMAENVKDPTIGVDEVYTLHLVRELKVVVIKHGGEEFEIPVNSAAKFGLVHDGKATYESVDDISSAKHLPKVITVKDTYLHPDGKVSLRQNEILLIKEVVKGKFGRTKSALRVFSLSSYKELVLPKDCDARFSTDPESTQLYLTDFLDNGIDFIPCSARIYPGEDSALVELRSSVVNIMRQEIHRSVIISLFRDNPNSNQKKDASFIDIPTSIDICVKILETDKSDEIYERIYKESEDLFTNYNPSKIQACVDARTDDQYMTQAQLLAEIRKEKAKSEIAEYVPQQYQQLLDKPSNQESSYQLSAPSIPISLSQHDRKKLKPPRPLPSGKEVVIQAQRSSSGDHEKAKIMEPGVVLPKKTKPPPPPVPDKKKNPVYEELDESLQRQYAVNVKTRIPDIPPRNARLDKEITESSSHPVASSTDAADPKPPSIISSRSGVHSDGNTVQIGKEESAVHVAHKLASDKPRAATDSSHSPYVKFSTHGEPEMSEQLNTIQTTLSAIMEQIGVIQTRQSSFANELRAMKGGLDAAPTTTITPDMSPADVQKALAAIGLSQYQESFTKEAVDGEMFMILDDEVLRTELGVNSKLHRARLMRLKGTAS